MILVEKYTNTVAISTNTAQKYTDTEEVSRANRHVLPREWKLLGHRNLVGKYVNIDGKYTNTVGNITNTVKKYKNTVEKYTNTTEA